MTKKINKIECSLFSAKMPNGFACFKVTKPADYVFFKVNEAFEKITGLKKEAVLGKKVNDVFSVIKKDLAPWLENLKKASPKGRVLQFNFFSKMLNKWYSVSTYEPYKGYLAAIFNDITDSVMAERLHKRRFELIFEDSKISYYEHNPNAEREQATPRWPKMFGYQFREKAPIKNFERWFRERLHPEDRSRAERMLEKKTVCDFECRIKNRRGKWRWVRVVKSTIAKNRKGKPLRVGGLILDITKRKRIEDDLKKEKDKSRAIIENTQAQLAYFDSQFNFVDVNRAYVKDCGYKKEELLGKNHFALFPNKENQAIFENVRDSGERAEFKAKPFVYKNRPWLGTTYWDWTLTPIKYRARRVVGLVLSLLNVTERVRQEKTLESYARQIEQERAEDEALLSSIGDGVIAVNTEKKLVFANQAFLKIFRKNLKEFKNKEFYKAFHSYNKFGNPVPYKRRPMIVSLLTGKKVFKDYLDDLGYYAKVGEKLIPLAITSSPIVLEGKTIGVIGVCRDMTREMEIDRAKNEFLSMAAHQLRTPLTTMSLSLEMILKGFIGKVNKDVKNYLNDFFKDVKNMSQLIKDLLNVSRLDMANLELKIEPYNPVTLVDDVVKNFEPQIEKKKLIIKKNYAARLPLVSTDEKLATMCIENIISNAINYNSPKGFIAADIHRNGSRVIIKITDNGCGIPKKEQDKVFEKLYRASNVMPKTTGTGLGLYIAKYAAEKFKGKIWFESVENKGTTFYISLPAYKA